MVPRQDLNPDLRRTDQDLQSFHQSRACARLRRVSGTHRASPEENLKQLDDDIDILKSYLKTQHVPKAAIEALEGLTVEQHVSWKKGIERIKKLLEYTELEVCGAMSVTVHFKDTSTNKITSLEYEEGAVIPKMGDHIVSPFNADRTALVSDVIGDGKRNPFSVLCAE